MSENGSTNRLLPAYGNYRELRSFQKAEIVYDLTYRFCERFLRKGDRTIDQMVQAARSGKQNIIVKLDSDPDALPMEHEQLHRRLVQQLVGNGVDPEDLGEIVIEREPEGQRGQPAGTSNEPQKQKASNKG